jgi:hypothetical protein
VTAIAPVDAVRDGEATERFVGDGTSTSRIVVSAMPGSQYDLSLGQRPTGLSIRLAEGRSGEWVFLSIAAAMPPTTVASGTSRLLEVASAAEVAAGNGTTYAYDPVRGRIYVKAMVANVAQYFQTTVGILFAP